MNNDEFSNEPLPAVLVGSGSSTQRHELKRPFKTALMAGLGFAVAAAVVLIVAFLLVLLLVNVSGGNNAPIKAPSLTTQSCDDGSTPTSQDGSLICDDGTMPTVGPLQQ